MSQEKNIQVWVKSQKVNLRFILRGIICHFKESDGFRFNCLVGFLYILTVTFGLYMCFNYWGVNDMASHPGFGLKLGYIFITAIGSLLATLLELLVLAMILDLLDRMKKFLIKMNERGVHETYGSLTKLADEDDDAKR